MMKHLTPVQRYEIGALRKQNFSQAHIARAIAGNGGEREPQRPGPTVFPQRHGFWENYRREGCGSGKYIKQQAKKKVRVPDPERSARKSNGQRGKRCICDLNPPILCNPSFSPSWNRDDASRLYKQKSRTVRHLYVAILLLVRRGTGMMPRGSNAGIVLDYSQEEVECRNPSFSPSWNRDDASRLLRVEVSRVLCGDVAILLLVRRGTGMMPRGKNCGMKGRRYGVAILLLVRRGTGMMPRG
jgi:hypothetical protein